MPSGGTPGAEDAAMGIVTWMTTAACAALLLSGCAAGTGRPPAALTGAEAIVALEGRFAAASRERGARAAFLEFLAEDAVILQPGPVWGRAAWESSAELRGTLDWVPDWAEVSADGSFGFASGPWRLGSAQPGAGLEGRYLTAWRRAAAGWQVVFDGGFGRPAGGGAGLPAASAGTRPAHCEPGPAPPPGELQVRDALLSGSAVSGHAARVAGSLADAALLFHPPQVDGWREPRSQRAALEALPATTQLWPMGGAVAASGDLGYTYGLSAPAADAAADASYAHVWCRRGGDWRVLLEIRSPLGR